ncbi:D-alanyl-D-alanine carboxypeptidase/D-alanyl-D-alanine endopeptidase [Paracoccus bogoriensis]|uniref:D-alanyl-D-alanine carboxypeptidase/D-alanyl-D-alanine endopeptidase n=1 Tax=Paracoccus bogoriensis TaxID=242065 RepID=UPI001FE93DBB|nr:D-alanyl-D-alanine carboxypeptidase/D-alanyl-D-alanine-endopeptidase [Paracoccus bogoriensis]
MRIDRRILLAGLMGTLVTPGLALADPVSRPPRRPPVDPRAIVARAGLPGQTGFALIRAGQPTPPQHLAQATMAIAPASTVKALTAMYALDRLGATHRFRTRLILAEDMLILAGGGDPTLSTDDLARLAADLAALGRPLPARFAVWDGALPVLAQIAPEQAVHLPYNPSISGLMLNFNRVHLGWSRVGADYRIQVEARGTALSPQAHTISARAADQRDLFTYREDGGREFWTVSRAALGGQGSRWLPVRLPALYAGDVFQTLARARGLALPAPEVITHLPQGETLAHHDSAPLDAMIRDMLRYSTNITAEALGLHASGAPDLAQSGARMLDWLTADEPGLRQGMRLADHSGLSEASRVSALSLARILAGPGAETGLPGLLRRNPLQQEAPAPEVAAKTGTLNFVSNLAGYVQGPSGARGAFAILCVDPARRAAAIGQEQPAGVQAWTRQARALQAGLLSAFAAGLG